MVNFKQKEFAIPVGKEAGWKQIQPEHCGREKDVPSK